MIDAEIARKRPVLAFSVIACPSHSAVAATADALVPQPMSCGASATMRIRLCANTNKPTTQRTLAKPRTGMRNKPRLRAWALTHSAVAARCL